MTATTEWYNVKFVDMDEEFNFSEMSLVRRSLDMTYSNAKDRKPTIEVAPHPGTWNLVDPDSKIVGQVKHMKLGQTILTEATHF